MYYKNDKVLYFHIWKKLSPIKSLVTDFTEFMSITSDAELKCHQEQCNTALKYHLEQCNSLKLLKQLFCLWTIERGHGNRKNREKEWANSEYLTAAYGCKILMDNDCTWEGMLANVSTAWQKILFYTIKLHFLIVNLALTVNLHVSMHI